MDILVLGSGGREHAICASLVASPLSDKVYVAPGNGGTAQIACNVALDIGDGAAVAGFAEEHGIGLVVIGPEAPLVAGVADVVREAGIPCFGPGAAGARIEGSKTFSKHLMDAYGLPTAAYGSFDDRASALAYLDEHPAPIVIKADGLAAGKGVVVASDDAEARAAVEDCFSGRFGSAGATVVIEEMLRGPECSILAFIDGKDIRVMAPSQDHKRAYEGDTGPNTGGMGVYSPVPIVTAEEQVAMEGIMRRTLEGMRAEGIDYRGCLYGGFMLTDEGPKLLEFNCRFGDPETQVVLPRLKSDLVEVMLATAEQRLADVTLEWRDEWAVSVVLASEGYPTSYEKGFEMTIPEAIWDNVYVAGAAVKDGKLVTNGGRVLGATAIADSLEDAIKASYEMVKTISFDNAYYRNDIGARALKAGRN